MIYICGFFVVMLTEKFLSKVAKIRDPDTLQLGLQLNIPREHIQQFENEFGKNTWRVNFEMLVEWQKTSPNQANNHLVEELISALTDLELMDKVELVRKGEFTKNIKMSRYVQLYICGNHSYFMTMFVLHIARVLQPVIL